MSDSKAVICIVYDCLKDELTKHIGVDASFMRVDVHDRIMMPVIATAGNKNDFTTKKNY